MDDFLWTASTHAQLLEINASSKFTPSRPPVNLHHPGSRINSLALSHNSNPNNLIPFRLSLGNSGR